MKPAEIDRQIAEKVFGMTPYSHKRGEYTHVYWCEKGEEPWIGKRNAKPEDYPIIPVEKINPYANIEHAPPEYSTNIAHAIEALEKPSMDWLLKYTNGVYGCLIYLNEELDHVYGEADTPEMAICLALLETVKE